MKPILLTLLSLLFLTPTAFAQGFVEEFRSEPGRRPPVEASWEDGVAAARIDDLNGNGAPDMPFILEIDGVATLVVYDGQTREKIWEWAGAPQLPVEDITFLRFYDFKGDGTVTALTASIKSADLVVAIGLPGDVEWQMPNAKLMAVADLDNDGRPEILVGDRDNRQMVMVGWEDGGSTTQSASPPSAAWSTPAGLGYDLTLKYESEPDRELAYDNTLSARLDNLDVNGDGVPEIVMLREDDNGDPEGLVVRNGTGHNVQWQFDFQDAGSARDDILNGFRGFFDVNGDGQREALFGQRTVVTLDKTVHTLNADFEILTILDLDDDGYADLIGRGLQNNTVQVWGRDETSTATEGEIEAALFRLFQNYPNPFRKTTTIAYEVAQPGPVTITIYDMLGRRVHRLLDGVQAVGRHQVTWDGRDAAGQSLASGTYLYRLQVGEVVQTRRMLFVK